MASMLHASILYYYYTVPDCATLQGHLPPWVHLPCSAALPFGAFEAVLLQPENAVAAAAVQKLADVQQPSADQLKQVRDAVLDLQANARLQDELKAAFQQSGKHMLLRSISASALHVAKHGAGACKVSPLISVKSLPAGCRL